MIAIVAALPREIKGLVSGLQPDSRLRLEGIFLYRHPKAVVVAAGMGSARVTRAFEAAIHGASIRSVFSVGLAGACAPGLPPGSVVEPSAIVDASTGERFRLAVTDPGPLLVSTESIASVQEKARLHASYGADLVDMEAATLARLAQAHGLPCRAVKGISDAHDFELASLSRFTGKHGHFRTAGFALHTATRPGTWNGAMLLSKHSKQALSGLARYLDQILHLPDEPFAAS